MASITPVAYGPGKSIAGTTQVGNLTVGTSGMDYPEVGAANGIVFYATPDQNLGYVIAHEDVGGTHNGRPGNIPAYVGFWRSPLLTENSFVEFTNSLFNQNFTGGTQTKNWLNSNGYWTSYSDIWQYDSLNTLTWTDSTAGYTLLTGGVTAVDDGYWVNPITIPTYYTNNQTSSNLYISTNAVVTLGVGYGSCCPSTPQTSSNPALISGNAGDMYANPGAALTDGTTMNAYYRITQNGDKTKIELKVFQAILSAQNSPYSYQLNLYRDSTYQWVETRVKSGAAGNVGPYNAIDVSEPASTTSRVWRGNLLGQNWVYLGTGTVIP
jgi:hypothetical protein